MEQTEDIVAILNQMPCPAFLVKDGIIIQANPPAIRYGITEGSSLKEILATGHQEYEAFQGGCLYLTLSVCQKSCGASVTRSSGFDIIILEQEDDQAELQAMALAAQHLRNPLSNVMTVADRLFPLTGTDGDPETQEQIARINRGLYQMLRIISNMSDAYRYSVDNQPRLEIRDVSGILEELFRSSAMLMQHSGITLHFTNTKETVYTLIDAEKLERAVSNILSNALKFTPPGGTIDAKLTRKGNMLYLTVQNSDVGRLTGNTYSPFQRGPGVEDGRFGIGLGMVLIRSAAAANGGTLLMEQRPEQGTRVTMTIAIRQDTDSTVRATILQVDYAGERDHHLLEFSDSLPVSLYSKENIN